MILRHGGNDKSPQVTYHAPGGLMVLDHFVLYKYTCVIMSNHFNCTFVNVRYIINIT